MTTWRIESKAIECRRQESEAKHPEASQGEVLRPLLYIVYTSDLDEYFTSKASKFSNDTKKGYFIEGSKARRESRGIYDFGRLQR